MQPWSKNPRILKTEKAKQLKACIDKFGLIDKPILNKDLTVIGGHQRINILKKHAVDLECYVADVQLSEKDAEELALSLNKKTGEWDWDKLANEFDLDSLLAGGFESKDFLDKGVKQSKPSITFDFESQEDLDKAMDKIIGFSMEIPECKVRVKNGN